MKPIGWMYEVKDRTFTFAGTINDKVVAGFISKTKNGISLEIREVTNENEEKVIRNSRVNTDTTPAQREREDKLLENKNQYVLPFN